MLLGLCVALALGIMAPLRAIGAGSDPATLKRIASRVDGRTGVIAIEATTPVPYIASQPDPKTFVIELRDVVATGFQNDFAADPRHPVAAVQVEKARRQRRTGDRPRAHDAGSADASARAKCTQRHLRRRRTAAWKRTAWPGPPPP